MAKPLDPLIFDDLRYGRDGVDPPLSLPAEACVEAYNVEFYESTLGKKRNGSTAITLWASPNTEAIQSLFTHLPAADYTALELWTYTSASGPVVTLRRLASGSWSAPTWVPAADGAAVGSGVGLRGCSFNGKLFLPVAMGAQRLHVYDGTNVRRVGLGTPVAGPTVANGGSGSYAATIRYYKVAFTVQSAGVTIRRSELSAVVSFTPSGSGSNAAVTRPAVVDETETHWELYGSADALTYVCIATTAIGTTGYNDTTAPASYTGSAEPVVGTNTVPGSIKYIRSDGGNRLLMAGSLLGTLPQNRVWFTPVLGSSDIGDDERVPNTLSQKNYIDLDEKDGGYITGLAGPVWGSMFVFKQRQIWKLVPTGVLAAPYRPFLISSAIGAVGQEAIVIAEDEEGQPCLYFLSDEGVYRYGASGLQKVGRDVDDRILMDSTYRPHAALIFYVEKRQLWCVFYNTSSQYETLVYQIGRGQLGAEGLRGGWVRRTAVSTPLTLYKAGAVGGTGHEMKPYFVSGVAIYKADTGTTDYGTTKFQAYVKTRVVAPAGLRRKVRVEEPVLVAHAADQTDVSVELIKDTGASSRIGSVSLTPEGSEEIVTRRVEGLGENDLTFLQFQIGDAEASSAAWNLDALEVPVTGVDPR